MPALFDSESAKVDRDMATLKGENQLRKFRRVAEGLVEKVVADEDVEGVVFIGGLVRGFVDRYSDLDVTVFLGEENAGLRRRICELASAEERRSGVEIDLEVHMLQSFAKRKWSEAERFEFSKAEIVFDRNGKVAKLFEKRLHVPEEFWVRRLAVCAEYLKWYCCPPKDGVGTVAEAWVDRGDLASAHYCVSYGVDLFLEALFAVNGEFLPPPKWRIFYSHRLKWLPEGYEALLKEAMLFRAFSVEELDRRLAAVRKLWGSLLPRIEQETGLKWEELSRYFVEKVLGQVAVPQRH
jgi:predicted nucleotidyltransferase